MMNILFISNHFSVNYLIECFALENPDCNFEILTSSSCETQIQNIKVTPINISWINGVGFPAVNTMLSYAIQNAKNYDFIFTFSIFFQNNSRTNEISTLILCPDEKCAVLEDDKLFTKNLLEICNIPTPKSQILDRNLLQKQLDDLPLPIVLKIARSDHMLYSFATNVFTNRNYQKTLENLLKYSTEQMSFFTEDFISGEEMSMHFLCNGKDWIYLGEARDYKKLLDGDEGINTDGIGCYSPVNRSINSQEIVFEYMNRLMAELNAQGVFYKGIMYLGVITDQHGIPYILEINTRPGVPEILTIVNRLNTKDLLENFMLAARGEPMRAMSQKSHTTVAIMIHHKSYDNTPKYEAKQPICREVPENLKLITNDIRLKKGNEWGIVIADADTKEQAADRIYSWLAMQYLGDYTTRSDIAYLD